MKTVLRALTLALIAALTVAVLASCKANDAPVNSEATDDAARTEETFVFAESESIAEVAEYTGEKWLEKEEEIKEDDSFYSDEALRITEIYSDCFFATTVIPLPCRFKINGHLSDEWCVGDVIECTFKNVYYDRDTEHIEADLVGIKASDFELDPDKAYKPVIYLYPEEKTDVTVRLDLDGELICSYPAYNEGWRVTADPDGVLTDENGKTYNYLYWEGDLRLEEGFEKGSCVRGADTAKFLEQALDALGLTRREANEFIVYWLPLMQDDPYNVISFETEEYVKAAELDVDPAPDTIIRVFMRWYPSDEYVEIEPQTFETPERKGFTVVEWGGSYAG
jgi:hypothetical protein